MATSKTIQRTLSPVFSEVVLNYFSTHHAAKLSRNLRCMLLDCLAYELRVGVPLYLDEFLWQLNDLFELLDVAQQETAHWHPPEKKEGSKE